VIAREEWLAAIGPALDSFNSYPHLRNLESYLDRVMAEHEAASSPKAIPLLSPLEMYVMLAAILFHDIGRAVGAGAHGEKSKRLVQEKYANLGIPSSGLAESLGRIVAFHDLSPGKCIENFRQGELRTVVVSPYGEIRERVCAALLLLVDHLDAAFTRVVPVYVRDPGTAGAVGAFRRAVQGVDVDLRSRMAVVVLSGDLRINGDDGPASRQRPALAYGQYTFAVNMDMLVDFPVTIASSPQGWKLVSEERDWAQRVDAVLDLFRAMAPTGDDLEVTGVSDCGPALKTALESWGFAESSVLPRLLADLPPENPLFRVLNHCSPPFEDCLWAVARGFLRAKRRSVRHDYPRAVKLLLTSVKRARRQHPPELRELVKSLAKQGVPECLPPMLKDWILHHPEARQYESDMSKGWLPQLLLAIIMGDTWANTEALVPIQNILTAVGVPIKAWLLEYDEHLYNRWGRETYEPIFNRDYLKRVAEAMWDLSVTVFAHDTFAYETLASQLRDPDAERVRRAVRRLSIVCTTRPSHNRDTLEEAGQDRSPIWLGRDKWRWDVRPRSSSAAECDFVPLGKIEAILDSLQSPEGRDE
jgi:hypothetical protein